MNTMNLYEDPTANLSIGLKTIYERHAEREAALVLAGVSFEDCVRLLMGADKVDLAVTVITKRGRADDLVIRSRDVYRAWTAFVSSDDIRLARLSRLTSFVGNFEALVTEFLAWLIGYQPRYGAVSTDQEREWLERVSRLALARRVMENKHADRMNGAFTDRMAQSLTYAAIMMRDFVTPNVARISHYASRNAEKHGHDTVYASIMSDLHGEMLAIMRETMNAGAEALPTLPPGLAPFRLLPSPDSSAQIGGAR